MGSSDLSPAGLLHLDTELIVGAPPTSTPFVVEAEQPAERQPDDLGVELGLNDFIDLTDDPPLTCFTANLQSSDSREGLYGRGLFRTLSGEEISDFTMALT